MVRGLRVVERAPALRYWLKSTTGASRPGCTRAVSAYATRADVHHNKDLPGPRTCRDFVPKYHAAPHQQSRALHAEVSRVLGSEGEASLDELKAMAEPHILAEMGVSDVMAWCRKWAAVYPTPSPYFLNLVPAEVVRVAERAVELLGSDVVSGSKDQETPVSIAFHFSKPLYRMHEGHESTLVARRLMEVVTERIRDGGLRRLSASQIGQLMCALGSTKHRDISFLEEVRDECLRRGLQTFRARSLGELMYGLGRIRGVEPGTEFREACVERASRRGFLSRDCTPADVAFLLWGYHKMRCTPSVKVLEDVAALCTKPAFIGSLNLREVAFLAVSFATLHHGQINGGVCALLYDEIRERSMADPQGGFSFSLIEELLLATRRPGMPPEVMERSLRPFVEAVCADVARLGPAAFSSSALIGATLACEALGLSEAERDFMRGAYLELLPVQGVDGCNTRGLCYDAKNVALKNPVTAMQVMDALVAEAVSRDDMAVDSVRRLIEAIMILRKSHGYAPPPDLSTHVERILAEATLDEARMDAGHASLSKLLYVLGDLKLCVAGDVLDRLVVAVVDLGLERLMSWQRSLLLLSMTILCKACDGQALSDVHRRLRQEVLAMWARCFAAQREREEAGGGAGEGQDTYPADMISDLMSPGSAVNGELRRLLHGLVFTPLNAEGSGAILPLAHECMERNALGVLSLGALHGLLCGLVEVGMQHQAEHRDGPSVACVGPLLREIASRDLQGYRPRKLLVGKMLKAHRIFRCQPAEAPREFIINHCLRGGFLRSVSSGNLRELLRVLATTGGQEDLPEPLQAALTEALLDVMLKSSNPTLHLGLMEHLPCLNLNPGKVAFQHVLSCLQERGLTYATTEKIFHLLRVLFCFKINVSEELGAQLAAACSTRDMSSLTADEASRLVDFLSGGGVKLDAHIVDALTAK